MSVLIKPNRVVNNPYYHTWRQDFRLAGYFIVPAERKLPDYDTWTERKHNSLTTIAHDAKIDGWDIAVVPVFVNDAYTKSGELDCDKSEQDNIDKPAVIFFKGNDDWSYGLRYKSFKERNAMLEFGAELGYLHEELIGHN